jgi:anti-sigma regulatory factor (Ser/Thr protein kinase)
MAELGTPTATPSSDDIAWRASVILKSTVHAPATARTWVRHHLAEHGLDSLTSDAALLVCELVTNVYRHAEDCPEALIEMAYYDARLRVEVSHQRVGDGIPHIGNDVDDGGRGLLIVEAYSDDCGVVISADTNSVWFALKSPC